MKARRVGLAVGVVSASAALIGLGSRLAEGRRDGAATAEGTAVLVEERMALSAMIALVDSKLTAIATTLVVIAGTPEAQSGDWERMRPLLARLAEDYPQGVVEFALPDGTTYTVATGLHPTKITDRRYFQEAMAGCPTIAELLMARATGESSVITAVPVKAGQRIVGLVAVAQALKPLSRWLEQSLRLPENTGFGAADAEGTIALDSEPEVIFRDVRSLGSPSLTCAFREMRTGREGATTYEVHGERRNVVTATSPLTGWRYVLGVGARQPSN